MTSSCWLVRRRLGAYHDGELPVGTRNRVSAHVRGCEPCSRELVALGQLRVALTGDMAEPSEAVWTAFWPQVRVRIAEPAPAREQPWRQAWGALRTRPRLGLTPALAAGVLAVLAMVVPWQRTPQGPSPSRPSPITAALDPAGIQPAALDQVVIQSIETEDPDVPVMVYASPESDVTVLWVFGLPRTDV